MALSDLKRAQAETWSLGNYSAIGSRLNIVSEQLCETADIRAGWKVVDLATGSGNTALAAARRGCQVTGVDFSESLLKQARARAAAEGLDIDFINQDVETLPFDPASFDAVLSTFGVVFTPEPESMAAEMLRVCRPGGVIALTRWAAGGGNDVENEVIARFFPDDAPLGPWDSETGIRELFGNGVGRIEFAARDVLYRFPTVASYVDTAIHQFGPFMRMAASMHPDDLGRMRAELIENLEALNRSGDASMVISFPYQEVVASRT